MAMWNPRREECFHMMKERSDLHFIFLTKIIERFKNCAPADWGSQARKANINC